MLIKNIYKNNFKQLNYSISMLKQFATLALAYYAFRVIYYLNYLQTLKNKGIIYCLSPSFNSTSVVNI